MSDECNICCEQYNKQVKVDNEKFRTGNKITCIKCDYSTCTYCTKRYLLETINDPQCMNCKHHWNREFMYDNFTKSFVNKEYKEYRESVLFDREKALIPATMEIINREKRVNEIILEKEEFRKRMEQQLYDFDVQIWNLQNYRNTGNNRNSFVKKCRVDNCKGYLSSQWKCGLCDSYTCKSCHVVIGERIKNSDGTTQLPEHTCNDDDIKTAMLLSKDTKNCPKCAVPIYKIDGCDQMWCVGCKNAFSWRTGDIITGRFHNPHYYEWLRNNSENGEIPREPGDNPCNVSLNSLIINVSKILYNHNNITNYVDASHYIKGLIRSKDYYNLRRTKNDLKHKDYYVTNIVEFFANTHRFCMHVIDIDINDIDTTCLINDDNNIFNYNLKVRKKYLQDECTEEHFKKEIQKREKKKLKLIDRKQIYQTFTNVVNDIFIKAVAAKNIKDILQCLKEIIMITNHINKQLMIHSSIYNCKVKFIHLYKNKKRFYNGARNTTINTIDISFTNDYLYDKKDYDISLFKK